MSAQCRVRALRAQGLPELLIQDSGLGNRTSSKENVHIFIFSCLQDLRAGRKKGGILPGLPHPSSAYLPSLSARAQTNTELEKAALMLRCNIGSLNITYVILAVPFSGYGKICYEAARCAHIELSRKELSRTVVRRGFFFGGLVWSQACCSLEFCFEPPIRLFEVTVMK